MNLLRKCLTVLVAACALTVVGQSGIQVSEGWIDGDVSARVSLPSGTAVDLSALPHGLHSLTVRVRDAAGLWSSPVTRCFVVTEAGTSITRREAWIDGNTSAKQSLAGSPTVIDLGELPPGVHSLTVRVCDDASLWSAPMTRYFVIQPTTSKATAIARREAWLDGNTAAKLTLAGAPAVIDLGELSPGVHSLTVRVRDDAGVWSNPVTRYFVIQPTATAATSIARREAWLDGNTAARQMLEGSPAVIDLGELSPGVHSLTVRVRDDAGVWSNPVTRHFLLPDAARHGEVTPVACLYWFDGNCLDARSQTIEGAQGVVDININHLDGGSHTISWSVCDNKGVWSDVITREFEANLYGDINNDHLVDVADLSAVINAVLGKDDPNIVNSPDLNGDGVVDVTDVALEINYILGRRG